MVKVTIHAYRGNANSRFYPHTGYLGLTPVKVEGVVRTKLDADGKPLQASSIVASVRCVESRLGRVGTVHTNVLVEYSQTLWSKPSGVEWADVGNAEHAFKIIIPAKTPGYSYTSFQEYRVFWRIDAVITHAPIFGVGTRLIKSYELPLIRYDARVPSALSPARFLTTRKPRAPVIRYQLQTPSRPVGPLDIVTIPLILHPVDPTVAVRSASLIVERRIELSETAAMPSPFLRQGSASPSPLMANEDQDSSGSTVRGFNHDRNGEPSSSTARLSPNPPLATSSFASLSSTNTVESFGSSVEQRPLLQPIMTDLPAKTISLSVAHVDSTGPFTKDSAGVYTKSLTLQWPANKSNSHWAMGETMQTELARVRFFIHVKVIVSSPYNGTETIELEERELFLISTNESDRKLAASKYVDIATRSKSKSPRRSKRDSPSSESSADDQAPSIPPVPQTAYSMDGRTNFTSHQSQTSPLSPMSTPPLRRPHTSSGLRDKANSGRPHHRHHEHYPRERERERDRHREDDRPGKTTSFFRTQRRPETALPASAPSLDITVAPAKAYVTHGQHAYVPQPHTRVHMHAHRSSRDGGIGAHGNGHCGAGGGGCVSDPGTVRAWEEELARIELKSRHESADMLAFKRQRTLSRPHTATSSMTSTSGSNSP